MAFTLEDFFAQTYPQRATAWQLRSRRLDCGGLPLLMGIVNVTPDSFSDGGRYLDVQQAVDHGLRLEDEGAALLDVGGESTRPNATPVAVDDELQRVLPVVEQLCRRTQIPISIDTRNAVVAEHAIELGAEIINDVTGLTGDPDMIPLALQTGVGICAMHMQGTPQTMQIKPTYDNVVQEIAAYLEQRRDALLKAGIGQHKICLDPGIGFGKTHQHNLTLMAHCEHFHRLGCPLLVGHSRKGFIGKVLGNSQVDRLAGVIGSALCLVRQGVQILRVHDILPLREAIALFAACGGVHGQEAELG